MVSFSKRSLLSCSLVVLLAIVLVPAHALSSNEGSQDPGASLAKRHATPDQHQDFARGQPFEKRSVVEEVPGDTRIARAQPWKRSLPDSEDPRPKFRFARPMAWKTKRAVGTVPDSGAAALDSLKPMRRASVFEKRAVGTVDTSSAKNSAGNAPRLVTRDTVTPAPLDPVEAIKAD